MFQAIQLGEFLTQVQVLYDDMKVLHIRDGRYASGYPRGCGYPLAISAKSDICIRIRIRWGIPAGPGGYPL
jgi:hypothetical protein